MVFGFSHAVQLTFFPLRMTPQIFSTALLASGLVGLMSAALPSYHASQINIVDGLRHIG
jgi:ABC-type antimicrobial peptide transport system permease subunit